MSSAEDIAFTRLTWDRLTRSILNLVSSEVGPKAKRLFALLIAFLFAVNALNVLSSYVGRDFMTAIADRNSGEFAWQAVFYIGVFALSTVVAVLYRFTEERLGLLWRQWLTKRLVTFYLSYRVYYRLDEAGVLANPDQRIADDVRSFTVTTLSFTLMLLNGTFTVVAFSGVLWSISGWLFVAAVAYAAAGTWLAIKLGRPLVRLNYDQLDKEANFRADLIHVRENAESVAMLHREGRLERRLLNHLDALVENFKRMIAVNRNLGFFTTGYNYLIQILPVLFVAPLYMRGEAEFGQITQAAIAFTQLLGAFSLIVTQFQSISNYAAVMARLSALGEAIEQASPTAIRGEVEATCAICAHPGKGSEGLGAAAAIEIVEAENRLAFEQVSLRSPRDGRTLVDGLTVEIPSGCNVLIRSASDSAKVALFRATAGIWSAGEGRIVRPPLERILFLPERPYLQPGTLREALLHTGQESVVSDERILEILRLLDAETVCKRAGGLDLEHDWDDMLSLGEQQSLAFARLLLAAPRFAFLDRPGTALSVDQVRAILRLLADRSITYLTLGDGDDYLDDYDVLLELDAQGKAKRTALTERPTQPTSA